MPASTKDMTCNNAGTAVVSLGSGVQTNDPVYLCFGDSIFVDHQGDQILTGDPITGTTPGIGYAFYKNTPTVDGPTLSAVLADPSVLNLPPAPGGLWVATGSSPGGDMYFKNNGNLQLFFNAGKPVQIWFAPITLDNWASKTFEGTPAGPCVNVNIKNAFPVVYLNKIYATNVETQPSGGSTFTGSFIVGGGWPEFAGAQNYNISISLAGNPAVKGTVTSGLAKHGSKVDFNVPQSGIYNITISDGKTCEYQFTVHFPAISYSIGQNIGYQGDTICVDVTVDNWTMVVGHTLYMFYDPNVLEFVKGSFVNTFNNSTIFFNVSTPGVLINLFVSSDTDAGKSIADGSKLFELCFKLIGNPLDCSPILIDTLNALEFPNASVTDGNFNYSDADLNYLDGQICILPPNAGLQIATSVVQPTCNGLTDGSIQIATLGGNAPYQYNWVKVGNPAINGNGTINSLGGSATINGLSVGIYTITVTDSSNPIETQTLTIQVQEPGVIAPVFDIKEPTCFDSNDGYIDITLTNGGTAPYNYSWSTGLNGPTATSLSSLGNGTYKVTITDDNNCTASFTQVLNKTQLLISILDQQNIGCGGGTLGSITLGVTGGSSPYDYTWNDVNLIDSTATNLTTGNYSVTVTDAEGCSNTLSTDIIFVSGITITGFDSISVKCGEDQNGQLEVSLNIPPGSSVASYTWSGPSPTTSTQLISGLKPGTYYITVTDNNGCAAIDSATLWAPAPITQLAELKIKPSCPGSKNGSVGVQIAGGTPPYNYIWSTNPGVKTSLAVIGAIGAGSYTVTISDANDCGPLVSTILLEDPPKIQVQFTNITAPSCFSGSCDGSAFADVLYSDGTPGLFNFKWESGETFNNVNASIALQLCAGWQSITITDGNCGIIDSVFIPANQQISVSAINITNTSCNGGSDGSITVDVTGGSPGYSYQWSNGGSITSTLNGLPKGDYLVTVTDNNGCTGTSVPFTINEPPAMIAQIDPNGTNGVTCAGDTDGSVQVFFTGGNPGAATYTWSPNVSTTESATDLGPGNYYITITDSKGCTDSVSYNIFSPPPINAVIPAVLEPECFGFQTSVTVSSASGGSGPDYSFSVDNGPVVAIGQPLSIFAGPHLITVFDKNGCFIEQNIDVNEPAKVEVNLGPDIEVELGDSIQLNPQGLPSDIASFEWTPVASFANPNTLTPFIKPSEPVEVTLNVTDSKGCTGSDALFIDVDNNRNVYIPNAFSPDGDGINDVFRVGTGTGVVKINYMKIFDRWGELLFEATDIPAGDYTGKGWDGRFKGQRLNPGVFVYMVEVKFLDNVTLLYRGDITIMR